MYRLLGLVTLLVLGGAQAPPQQPAVTFKVEVNYVEIDAVVTDAQGNFVSGLTKEDFQVIEEGKPQTVTAFTLVNIPVHRADPPLHRTAVVEPDAVSNHAEFNGRVFLLVLDDLWTEPHRSRLVRAAAAQFVRRFVGSNDLAAVVTTSGGSKTSQDFTGSQARLVAAIDKFVGRRQIGEQDQERAMKARNTYTALAGLADYLGGIRGRRKAIVWFCEGIDYEINDVFTSPNADIVRQEMQNAIGVATRANVAFYGVDPRGVGAGLDQMTELQGLPDPQNNASRDPNGGMKQVQDAIVRAQNSLRTVSTQTGGFAVVNRNDLNGAFQEIVRDNSSYYVLGYYSTDDRRDGKFRSVQVKVTRPGLQVKARKGYVAPKGPAAAIAPPLPGQATPALRDALASPIPASGLGLTVAAAPFSAGGSKASLAVVVEFDPARLSFKEEKGVFTEDLELVMVAMDANNKSADGARDEVPLRLTARTHESVQQNGFRMLRRLQVPSGRYQLRVGAREGNGGAVGSVVLDVDVPDFAKAPLLVSGLALASAAAARIPTANPDPAFKDVLPSSPTAQREFPVSDTLALFADVYDNLPGTPHRVAIKCTVTADDGAVVFTNSDERRSEDLGGTSGAYGYQVTVPLKGWQPGRYVLRVEAQALVSKGATASRELEFRVR